MNNKSNNQGLDLAGVLLIGGFVGLLMYKGLFSKNRQNTSLGSYNNKYSSRNLMNKEITKEYFYTTDREKCCQLPTMVETVVQPVQIRSRFIANRLLGGIVNGILA